MKLMKLVSVLMCAGTQAINIDKTVNQ